MTKEKIYDRGITAKRPVNEAEGLFFDKMRQAGWGLTKRGWPDFFCVNDKGEVCCVEVKPTGAQRLKNNQAQVMRALSAAGIKCYKWAPDTGFTSIKDCQSSGQKLQAFFLLSFFYFVLLF